MAGVFPDGGVIQTAATNTVDVATTGCTTELFYSTSRCKPRFEPAAMNALISEILNAVAGVGNTYDCAVLTNLSTAIQSLSPCGATQASAAEIAALDRAVDRVLICAAGNLRSVPLATLDTFAVRSVAAVAGTDINGLAFAIGDPILTLANGNIVSLKTTIAMTAIVAGVDTFGTAYAIGDNIVIYPNGTVVSHAAAAGNTTPCNGTAASAAEVAALAATDTLLACVGGNLRTLTMANLGLPAVAGAVPFGIPTTVQTVAGNTASNNGLVVLVAASANERIVRITGSGVNDTIHVGTGAAVTGAPTGFTPLAGNTVTHVTGREDGTRVVWGTLAAGASISTRVNDTTGNGVGTLSVETWNT